MIEPILIDTDVIIDHLRGMEKARRLLKAVEEGKLSAYFSTVTEAEVYSGEKMEGKAEKRRVQLLLDLLHRVDVNGEVARRAGEFRRKYRVELPNAIIAATAIHTRAKLVTRNIEHYEPIKGLKTRTIEEILSSVQDVASRN